MVRLGRGPVRRPYTPNNKGMFERANAQVEALAASQAVKHRESLKIDGPRFAFWRKLSGSIPCSCSATRDASSPHAHVNPGERNESKGSVAGFTKQVENTKGRNTIVGVQSFENDFDDDDDFLSNFESKAIFDNDEDILDAMDGEGSLELDNPSLMDFDDPFGLFGNKIIDCPICFGQSYQDSWQLHNGLRLVLDTSNAYGFEVQSGTVDNTVAGPHLITLTNKGKIYWTAKLPMYFNEVIRVRLFNRTDIIDPELYTFSFITADNSISGAVDEDGLMSLIGVDQKLTLVLDNNSGAPMEMTHAEIIINYAPFDHCQLPEVPAAYEEQFLDWNVSTNAEVPAGLDIHEGDYFCDEKYKRVWKINSINRRVTAGQTEFGSALDIRVLHSFERLFGVLNVFK